VTIYAIGCLKFARFFGGPSLKLLLHGTPKNNKKIEFSPRTLALTTQSWLE
jgi:hypothetical protein